MHLSFTTATARTQRLISVLLLSVLTACGGGGQDGSTQARTEHDFAADPTLRLNYGAVGVTFMEAKGAAAGSSAMPDTGDAGMDVMPLRIAEQTTTTYSLDPKDDTLEKVQLVRLPNKGLVFEITPSSPRATVALAPGDYDLLLYSGHKDAQPRTLFLQSNLSTAVPQGGAQAGVALTPVEKAKEQLLSTNRCPGCNLVGVDLSDANLEGADLSSANLYGAKIPRANLLAANLAHANLSLASFYGASLYRANLVGANMLRANLFNANVYKANLTDADLSDANLTHATLSYANLTNSNLTRADLRLATLYGATLYGAILNGANLGLTELQQAKLDHADFTSADMSRLDRSGVDFTGAIGWQR